MRNNKKSNKSNQSKLNQVRIIGGQYKRRAIEFIDLDGLRPTPDRLRETLFNWLMSDIYDAHVLDVCAGSGVLGFESISRGAMHTAFIEVNQTQYQQLKTTANTLKITPTEASFYCGEAQNILPTLAQQKPFTPFDVVFLDPPYALNLWQSLLSILINQQLINHDSLIYIEADQPLSVILSELSDRFEIIKEKKVASIYAGLIQLIDKG